MERLQLSNKKVLITGANSGIGKAIALLFAKEGADISFIYHKDEKDAEKTKKEIEEIGRRAIAFEGDIDDLEFCKETLSQTISEFGNIDILVNNAGTQIPSDNIIDLEEQNIRKTFDSNIIGILMAELL